VIEVTRANAVGSVAEAGLLAAPVTALICGAAAPDGEHQPGGRQRDSRDQPDPMLSQDDTGVALSA
jgi:hypothetical protein